VHRRWFVSTRRLQAGRRVIAREERLAEVAVPERDRKLTGRVSGPDVVVWRDENAPMAATAKPFTGKETGMKAVVLADTHLLDSGSTRLPPRAWAELCSADVILHAGDVTGPAFLAQLRQLAPVYAVLGNNDTALTGILAETVELELAGIAVAMVHDSGPRIGREFRLRRRFPTANVVVFGHSHIPWNASGVDGQQLFNPGSPTQRRRQPVHTIGILDLDDGSVRAEIVVVD
jgi:uncharacterized protein